MAPHSRYFAEQPAPKRAHQKSRKDCSGGQKLPFFIADGISISSQYADIRHRVERTCRAVLNGCRLHEEGGFLYLRIGNTSAAGRDAAGELLWIKSHWYEETLSTLDGVEEPWRRRSRASALPHGDDIPIACWAYFPEREMYKINQ